MLAASLSYTLLQIVAADVRCFPLTASYQQHAVLAVAVWWRLRGPCAVLCCSVLTVSGTGFQLKVQVVLKPKSARVV